MYARTDPVNATALSERRTAGNNPMPSRTCSNNAFPTLSAVASGIGTNQTNRLKQQIADKLKEAEQFEERVKGARLDGEAGRARELEARLRRGARQGRLPRHAAHLEHRALARRPEEQIAAPRAVKVWHARRIQQRSAWAWASQ